MTLKTMSTVTPAVHRRRTPLADCEFGFSTLGSAHRVYLFRQGVREQPVAVD